MVQVKFTLDVAHKAPKISHTPVPLLPEPGSLQPWQVKQDTRTVLARSTRRDAVSALAAAVCAI